MLAAGTLLPPPRRFAKPGPARAPRPPDSHAKKTPLISRGDMWRAAFWEKLLEYRSLRAQLDRSAASAGCGSCCPEGFADRLRLEVTRGVLGLFGFYKYFFPPQSTGILYLPRQTARVLRHRCQEHQGWAGCWDTRSLYGKTPRLYRSLAPEVRKMTDSLTHFIKGPWKKTQKPCLEVFLWRVCFKNNWVQTGSYCSLPREGDIDYTSLSVCM